MTKEKVRTMSVGNEITPFGCCNFFDNCTDELMTLSYSGTLGLIDWMGWVISNVCHRTLEFITCVRPEMNGAVPTEGNIVNPCSDPDGFEVSSCKLTVDDFARYGRKGPVRDIQKPEKYCITSPRRRLDGMVIASEFEWDIRFALDVLLTDLRRDIITGNFSLGTHQIDGLERWVRTGYSCSALDSYVIDWNGNPMTGGNGITWNGNPIANTFDLIQVLLSVWRRIRTRAGWAAALQNQTPRVGDTIILLPTQLVDCLLDYYTCWAVCPSGPSYSFLQTYEARNFRNSLLGGMFGYGKIFLDGFEIPLMAWDWNLQKSPTLADMYLLTRAWGSQRVWEGEHISAETGMGRLAESNAQGGYFVMDGGRIIGKTDTENLCQQSKIWMFPRTFCHAPWMQVRFQDVQCAGALGAISADPLETSFFPLGSCEPSSC